MKKEDITVLVQLLTSMNEAVERLEDAYNRNDTVHLAQAKKEILNLQREVDKIL